MENKVVSFSLLPQDKDMVSVVFEGYMDVFVAMRMKPVEASLIAGVYRPGYD
jgi:hypothetical protein